MCRTGCIMPQTRRAARVIVVAIYSGAAIGGSDGPVNRNLRSPAASNPKRHQRKNWLTRQNSLSEKIREERGLL